VFGQFAIYRARRYRLTRTVCARVRFWMDGSGWAYARRATLWVLFAIVTLGNCLAVAAGRARTLQDAALPRYGDLQGRFEGRGWAFSERSGGCGRVTPIAIAILPVGAFLYAYYKAVECAGGFTGIRFGGRAPGIDLAADAPSRPVLEVIGWSALLSTALRSSSAFFAALIGGRRTYDSGGAGRAGAAGNEHSTLAIVMVVGYLALRVGLSVVSRLYRRAISWAECGRRSMSAASRRAANVFGQGRPCSAPGEASPTVSMSPVSDT